MSAPKIRLAAKPHTNKNKYLAAMEYSLSKDCVDFLIFDNIDIFNIILLCVFINIRA